MNREQAGILTVALVAVVTLGVSATTFAGIVERPDQTVGSGSAVFSEDVTLEDSPNPQDRDLSNSPFLEALYDTVNPAGESSNGTNETVDYGGGTNLGPIVMALGSLLLVGIVGTIGWFWRLRWRSDESEIVFEEDLAAETEVDEDIEDVRPDQVDIDDLSNDVFRAWYEFFQQYETPPRKSFTPRELASVAIDQGADPTATMELTELFEGVRYGQARPTAEAERAARDALARIETEAE